MWFTGFRRLASKYEQAELETFLNNNSVSLLILAILAISLTSNLHNVVSKQLYENRVRKILLKEIETSANHYDLALVKFEEMENKEIVRATVTGIKPLSAAQVKEIETKLPPLSSGTTNELRIRFVQTTIINREGEVNNDIEPGTQSSEP